MRSSTDELLSGISEAKPLRVGMIKIQHLVFTQVLPLTCYEVRDGFLTFGDISFASLAARLKLPESYTVEHVLFDAGSLTWCLGVSSPELPEVAASQPVPALRLMYERDYGTGEVSLQSISVEGQ